VLESCSALEAAGFELVFAVADSEGRFFPASAEAILNDDTGLISCMHVNNEPGAIQPLDDIFDIAEAYERRMGRRISVHVDAVQSFGKIPLQSMARRADFISVSAHKLHGPKGVGALFIGPCARFSPLIVGGGQERGLRSGTENVPAIAGFGLAALMARRDFDARLGNAAACKRRLLAAIRDGVKDIKLNGPDGSGADSHILNISFLGVKGEVLLHDLEQHGVFVSTGAACSSKKGGSHVLKAMGLSAAESEGAIRFSFGDYNTEEEMDRAAIAVRSCVERFRRLGRYR
jgi:cysteine desulfurase